MVKRDSETVRRPFKKFSRSSCVCFAAESDRPSEVVLVLGAPSFSLERATFSRCHEEYSARVSRTRSAEVDRAEGTGGRSLLAFMRDGCHLDEMRRGGDGAMITLEGADLFLSPNVGTGGLDGGAMVWVKP